MLGNRELTMDDYLEILKRRWWLILVPGVVGAGIAFGVSLLLHSSYVSRALILVDQQRVPDTFVQPVVTEDIDARLSNMEEQILSRTRLEPLIDKYALFKNGSGQEPMEELVDTMRKAIVVSPVNSVVTTKSGALPGFHIGFTYDDPRVAQQVCEEITSMFIDQDLRFRLQAAQGTTNFLQGQLDDAKRQLDEQDAKLADFKRRYIGELPDDTQANLNLLTTLNTQLEAVTQSLNRAQQDKVYTESLLAQQVGAWQAFSAANAGNTPQPQTLQQELAAMQSNLVLLESHYTPEYPDVIKLKNAIRDLKAQIKKNEAAAETNPAPPQTPAKAVANEPPQIQQLRSQLRAQEDAIQTATKDQKRLKAEISLYESRIQMSPVVEQQYAELTRGYQTALEFYNGLLKKRDDSAMASDLQSQQQGEQFRIIDPPNLPVKPDFPNRPMFAGGGLVAGLALGLGLTWLLEMRDNTLRTERDVESLLSLPVLALVPPVKDLSEIRGGKSKKGRKRTKSTPLLELGS